MVKKLLILGAVVLAGLFIARKTHFCSYASTFWTQVRQEAKSQIPNRFELQRIRDEVNRMDGDIKGMVGPIAEHMASIDKLKRDIDQTRTKLQTHKTSLQTMVADLDKGGETFVYQRQTFSADEVRKQDDREVSTCKLLEATLAQQQKLLAAKEQVLRTTRDQLNTLIAQKCDFEIRVAELETRLEEYELQKIASDPLVDNGRATALKADLEALDHRINTGKHAIEILRGGLVPGTPAPQAPGNTNLDEVRNYLQAPAANGDTKTAKR